MGEGWHVEVRLVIPLLVFGLKMSRKKHAAEHEEQMRREAEHKARKEREKAIRQETKRLERIAEEDRRQRRRARDQLREAESRELYDAMWKALLAPGDADDKMLRFEDIPWPVMVSVMKDSGRVTIADLTTDAISTFLLPPTAGGLDVDALKKDRKEKLRETMLRFHPDKFEGRIMKHVRDADRELVKEGVGIVARTINALMGDGK